MTKELILNQILEVYQNPLVCLMSENNEERMFWLTELLRRMKDNLNNRHIAAFGVTVRR